MDVFDIFTFSFTVHFAAGKRKRKKRSPEDKCSKRLKSEELREMRKEKARLRMRKKRVSESELDRTVRLRKAREHQRMRRFSESTSRHDFKTELTPSRGVC